jgi:hypothetical protein
LELLVEQTLNEQQARNPFGERARPFGVQMSVRPVRHRRHFGQPW